MKCKVNKICGGCDYLGIEYSKQLAIKKQEVQDLLAKNRLNIAIDKVYGAKQCANYRNKVIVGFTKVKGKVVSGLYAKGSHRIVKTTGCRMHPRRVNELIERITELVESMKIELYNPRTGTGLLRHVLIRYAKNTDRMLVVFVCGKKQFPSRRNLVNVLVSEFPEIETILQSVNARDTSVVLENESMVLYGKGTITDELCGLKFTMGPNTFYQIHHDQCEVLYNLAKQKLKLKGTENILDTYCGIGTIGLTLAGSCKQVTGVELNADSIGFAKLNAKQNKIRNAKFVAMDSTRFMQEASKFKQNYDVIVLDPPRAGTTKQFIENATALHPDKILYISCDPKTLVRDLHLFFKQGYKAKSMDLVDMFPHTRHIESVVLLERTNSKILKIHRGFKEFYR